MTMPAPGHPSCFQGRRKGPRGATEGFKRQYVPVSTNEGALFGGVLVYKRTTV